MQDQPQKGVSSFFVPSRSRFIVPQEPRGIDPIFHREEGIFFPDRRPVHAPDAYDEQGCEVLFRIQRDHFWYRGRHRLLLSAFLEVSRDRFGKRRNLKAIDLGGGCGGWLDYLYHHGGDCFDTLAIADSSLIALRNAGAVVGSFAERYCVDLHDLPWEETWDVAFLLDVLEHISDHKAVLREVAKVLRPGGLLFITAPALHFLWTQNDAWVHHQRRYTRRDFRGLALWTEFRLLRADYFMFCLSPLLAIQRVLSALRPPKTPEAIHACLEKSHRVPPSWINTVMGWIFGMEAALCDAVSLPWGTSILVIMEKSVTPPHRWGPSLG